MTEKPASLCSYCGTLREPTQNGEKPSWRENLEKQPEYRYNVLPKQKGRIRVLVLKPDPSDGPTIQCELKEIAIPVERSQDDDAEEDEEEQEKSNANQSGEQTRTDYDSDVEYPNVWKQPETDAASGSQSRSSTSPALPSEKSTQTPVPSKATTDQVSLPAGNPPETNFEALSWCWGKDQPDTPIALSEDETLYKKAVTREMYGALRALRYRDRVRHLWVDAICIDQDDLDERNHQVEMMAHIYGRASRVCIWLGEGNISSKMALDFIRNEVLQLRNFDALCESKENAKKWNALLDLMQRAWFSRRWVVQEIALARRAVVYCGSEKISWKKFAIAVELFVEVETATHRLSEVMKKDENFYHVPGWFEYVSMLGASLLVEATGKLFRDWKPNGPSEKDSGVESDSDDIVQTFPPPPKPFNRGDALLNLEYLVSSLAIFKVSKPHDAIYSLLAIAKDTIPMAVESVEDQNASVQEPANQESADKESSKEVDTQNSQPKASQKVVTEFSNFAKQKTYIVDYKQPYSEACKEFVQFCIENSDPTRALDILCRPWAPEPEEEVKKKRDELAPDNDEANASKMNGKKKPLKIDASQPATAVNPADIPLPSWIARLKGAAYEMYFQPGSHAQRMGRKNADPLVGLPTSNQSLQRTYSAAGSRKIDLNTLRFRRRDELADCESAHCSMYVQGFVLDSITAVEPASQVGAIPQEWANLAGWKDCPGNDPPDQFWRTLVADRGRDGRNPPVYYSRACKESFNKGGLSSGSVNTTDLINNERCSVVAQFCRRVQSVIWNRCLIKTERGHLGLAPQSARINDLICIFYGCSVPVVLRRVPKTEKEVEEEVRLDRKYLKNELKVRLWKRWEKYQKWKKANPRLAKEDSETRKKLVKKRADEEADRTKRIKRWEREYEQARGKEPKPNTDPPTANGGPANPDSRPEWKDKAYNARLEEWFKRRQGDPPEREAKKASDDAEKQADDVSKKLTWKDVPRGPRYYRLVGESYVHGMMDGEAITYQNKNEIPPQTFELR